MTHTVSLNELEFMTRKAFRGAGYHWGEAEEAGKAAVWLARRNLLPLPAMLGLLARVKADVEGSRAACPVRTGLMLADGALRELRQGSRMSFELCAPVLLLPFLADGAADGDTCIAAAWSGCSTAIHDGDLYVGTMQDTPEGPQSVVIERRPDQSPAGMAIAPDRRTFAADKAAWDALARFAAETYVPATSRSRLAGAGAGVSDND